MRLAKILLISIITGILVSSCGPSCEDIEKDLKEPALPKVPRSAKNKGKANDEPAEFTKAQYEEIYFFLAESDRLAKVMAHNMLNSDDKDKDLETFFKKKSVFQKQKISWEHMITVKINRLLEAGDGLPADHPAPTLIKSLRLFREELQAYERAILMNRPFDDSIETSLEQQMKKTREVLDGLEADGNRTMDSNTGDDSSSPGPVQKEEGTEPAHQ